ncbi:hypothetical protein TNCV_1058881 [Trichonephila clavipes]|nr:hypothetical protein TNCV_1058881 [Trichonephila clavipes]
MGKLTAKISTIRMRHEKSCKEMQAYTAEELQPTKWIIYKTVAKGINTYEVNKVKDCDCPIRCHKCQYAFIPSPVIVSIMQLGSQYVNTSIMYVKNSL